MLETLLTPIHHCICPSDNYTCLVTSATEISWETVGEHNIKHTSSDSDAYFEEGGYQVTFRNEPEDSFSSSLHISDLGLNGTNFTCEGFLGVVGGDDLRLANTTTVCVVGICNVLVSIYLLSHYH